MLAAHSIGEGNYEQAKVIIRQSILAIGVAGIFLTLIVTLFIAPNLPAWMHAEKEVVPLARSYLRIIGMGYLFNISLIVCSNLLRCAGDTKTPMKFNILTNIINVVGNYLLIYPSKEIQLFGKNFLLQRAGLGVSGAAAATSMSIAFSGIGLLLILFLRQTPYQISLKEDFSPDSFIIRRAIRLAVPTAMERMTISFGQIAATSIITGLGTMALSANLLADTGEKICYLPVYGFATAGTTLVAQSLGAEEKDLALHYGRWCNRLGIIVMLVTSTAMFLFAVPIIDLFTDDTETILLAAQMLRIEAFAEPLLAIGVVLGGVLRGAGDTRWPFVISLLGMWVVRLPLAYTTLGAPDKRLDCKNFDKLELGQKYFNVYWYDENGEIIAAGMCAQWKNDSEFMLKSFSRYYPMQKDGVQTADSGSFADTGPGSGSSLREDYDDPEDLYEDGDYEDFDEAWDEWEEGW